MNAVIDADTHVVESEQMWAHFPKEAWGRRPLPVPVVDPETGRGKIHWMIDGHLVPHPEGKGGENLRTPPLDPKERQDRAWTTVALLDVEARLQDADTMGVEVEVVYPTLFIAHLTWDAALDVALAKAYNRFLAAAWAQSSDRLRWVAVLPFKDIPSCLEELRWAREHGAVGFLARGIEGDRSLAEPYFFPVYQEATVLDLPLCIHTGPGCPAITSTMDSRLGTLAAARMPVFAAAQHLIVNRIPEKFPDLRIGFVENGASWVPYMFHYVERKWRSELKDRLLSADLFRDYRIFVTVDSDEDIPYLAGYLGEDNLITGSDYGHHGGQVPTLEPISFENRGRGGDGAADLAVFGELLGREDLSQELVQKIMVENPRRFYGL